MVHVFSKKSKKPLDTFTLDPIHNTLEYRHDNESKTRPDIMNASRIREWITQEFRNHWWQRVDPYNIKLDSIPVDVDETAFRASIMIQDGRVCFIPYSHNAIGIFTPYTNSFKLVYPHGLEKMDEQFCGAVLSPTNMVVLIPKYGTYIGIFNPVNETFHKVIPYELKTRGAKFSSAVLLADGTICMTPYDHNYVGLFDPISSVYSEASITAEGTAKFNNSVLMPDGRVCFVPCNYSRVCIYNPVNQSFKEIMSSQFENMVHDRFRGGTYSPAGHCVVFAPFNNQYIAYYDIHYDEVYECKRIDIGEKPHKFDGAITISQNHVIFIPYSSDVVGIYLAEHFVRTNVTYLTSKNNDTGMCKYSGGTLLPDGRIVCAPNKNKCIGIISGLPQLASKRALMHPIFNKY